jgi:triacylglycerol lipase
MQGDAGFPHRCRLGRSPTAVLTFAYWVLALVAGALVLFQGASFVVALYEALDQPDARHVRPTAAGLLIALRGVAVETIGLFVLVLLWPLGGLPWRRGEVRGGGMPIVCVPGWGLSRACFLLLRHRLRRDGWPDVWGVADGRGDVAARARRLRDAVEACCARTGAARVALVAHGVGGLVCREYLRRLDGIDRVVKVVTLASPHRGSKLFALAPTSTLQALRPESPSLAELGADDPIPAAVDFTAIYASFDTVVIPAALALYPGAGNIEVEGVGHFGTLWSRRIYDLVRENLEYVSAEQALTARTRSR